MVFDLAESVTVAARHVVARLLAQGLTFSFDIDQDLGVDGNTEADPRAYTVRFPVP